MDGARPSSGAAATSRGPEGNRHPDGSAESRAHDARTLSTMDGTLRDSCERIRDRVAELAGDARPRVVSEMEAALSQVEYDLNGAEFLLAQLKEALAVSAPLASDSAPPVAAYRASLRGSRSALDAVREAARLARPRAAGDARGDAAPPRAVEETPRRDVGAAPGAPEHLRAGLRGIWKGTVRLVRELLEEPFGADPDARAGSGGERGGGSRASRRGEVPGEEALRDAPEESEDYQVSAGYYPAPGRATARSRRGAGDGDGAKKKGRSSRRRSGRSGTRSGAPEMSPVMEEASPRKDPGASPERHENVPPRGSPPPDEAAALVRELPSRPASIRTTISNARPPVRRALVPEAGPGASPEPGAAETPRSDAATETDSDVGSDAEGYKALVGMYAGVQIGQIGQSPRIGTDASADEVSEADTTPRGPVSPEASPEEERERNEPRPFRPPPPRGGADDASARDALFSTSSGGDARAPESDSWKPEGAFDPAVSGRRARRSEKELEKDLERGVRRLEKGGESLAAASRLADDANAAGEALLSSLRGQTESLARNSEALRRVGSDMEKNEKLVGDMSSWTRLGAKPRRRPWG